MVSQDDVGTPDSRGTDEAQMEDPVTETPEPDSTEDDLTTPADQQPEENDPLAVAERERDEYLDALQRLKAEFENFRRRNDRDRVAQREAVAREVILDVVPVIDNLDRAVDALTQVDPSAVEGVQMVRDQLLTVLGGRGLKEMTAMGAQFDPTQHEAVSMAPSPEKEGTIIAVMEKGYCVGDTVIRAAKVVVSAGP